MKTYSVVVQMLKRVRVVADSLEEACDTAKVLLTKEYPEWDVYTDKEDSYEDTTEGA